MLIPFKKDPIEFNQRSLFATNVFDLLPSDHPCYVYEDIFEQLDTSSVEENYSILGQNAYHPRLIIGILIYTQNANDKQEAYPAVEEIEETTGGLPDKMSLDNGYMSGDNLEAFDGKDIEYFED